MVSVTRVTHVTLVFSGAGLPRSIYLSKVPLYDIALLKAIQIVGIPLHHGGALGEVLGFVVNTRYALLDMR